MAEAQPNIQAILAALAAQSGASTTPSQGQAPAPSPYAIPGYQQGPAPGAYGAMPPSVSSQTPTYPGYPVDLNAIRPVTSGTMNLGDLDRPDARTAPPRHFRSRSRSPPRRDVRDNVNPYRDERRNERGAHVRDYGRDRDRSESPDNSEIIDVESTLVGLVIGRQGENLRRIESETSCRVQFLSSTGEQEAYRQCKITGPRPRRAEAKAAINKTIDDSGMGAIARAGLDRQPHARREVRTPNPNALRDGEDYEQIVVPDRTVGLIIGRGGETIRDLQERSGCHINIVGEDQSNNGLRPVNLIGPTKATALAKTMIMEIVDSDNHSNDNNASANKPRQQRPDHPRDNGQGGPDKVNDSIFVPSEAVGMIIGKGGETIREMQNTTGCKINVTASSGPNEVQREIGLVGSRDAINRAKRAIEDKVDAVRQKNNGASQGRGGRNQHRRDWDSPSYPQQSTQPAEPAASAANGAADPYAPCKSI
ncbi:uncharacterized protein F4807DRAFT_408416 [Annulohypoxylon truncatum]|uniref:uncharacterized protein n=1 Tax=Annulohypoxylon truncatum TaxID=327061 RepID=UPI00200872E4|nr:uncharacterized protein F4807DRAFT_408416 [Annulohypoxylon truncatum]KAI1213604.1 hypothetical protein F4807DRAFT_408416 [Annulohypoxylon truncatum]